MSGECKPIDVLMELDVLRHTLPILVADAQKAHKARLSADPVCERLVNAKKAIAELIDASTELLAIHADRLKEEWPEGVVTSDPYYMRVWSALRIASGLQP